MNRNRTITRLVIFLTLLCAVAWGSELPNVVMIMADDLGWSDIAAYREYQANTMGHDLSSLGGVNPIPTPNMDRLCAEGMMFTDAYSAAGLCAPTRFSMLTGSNSYRNGRAGGTWVIHNTSGLSAGRNHITVAEIAQTAGYRTAFFGKMHVGGGTLDGNESSLDYEAVMPDFLRNHGFDYTFVVHPGIQADPYLYMENDRFVKIDPADPFNPSVPGTLADTKTWTSGTYPGPNGTGIIQNGSGFEGIGDINWNSSQNGIINSRKAAAFIDDHLTNHPGKPFMMYYCPPQVHTPHTPPTDFEPNADGTPGSPPNVPVAGTTGGNDHSDMIYELDLQVGWIIGKLEDPNGDGNTSDSILDDTLFMFTSDNGGLGPSNAAPGYDSTGVLQSFKGSPYEGGHRVPFIARWPGMIASNSVSRQVIGGHDWVGVMYALTTNSMAADQAMDCVNLLPTLLGEQPESEPLRDFMVLHRNKEPYVMRQGDYVLFLDSSRDPIKLYNLSNDLEEATDLFTDPAEQQRISDMTALFRQHDDQNDPRSTPAYVPPDNDPPTPNPAVFSTDPTALGASSISMTAETGSDVSAPVEYLFAETSGHEGGSDSGWQTSPTYIDDKLLPGLTYSYTVQMRDASTNTGTASTAFNATTSAGGSSTILTDDFEASAESGDHTAAPYPVEVWHHQGANSWQRDDQPGDASVMIGNYSAARGLELRIGWGYDEVVTLYSTTASIDTNATYTFSGDWEIRGVKAEHRGFIAGLAEFSVADGSLVQRLTPDSQVFGNTNAPVVDETGTFSVAITPTELATASASSVNRIGVFFHHDDGAPLYDDDTGVANDVYLINDVELTVETTPVSMFEQWQINYGVSGPTNDPDGDGLVNLAEFARGGVPNDSASAGHRPTVAMNSGSMLCVYARRIGSGLTYWLETSTNLVENVWTNSGYIELPETGSIDADFEAVTNEVDVGGERGFVRLRTSVELNP